MKRLVGDLIRDFHEALELSDSEEESDGDNDPWEDQRPVKQLAKLDKLEEVTLIAFRDYDVEFNWKIPCFHNLRKLVVNGMKLDDNRTDGKSTFSDVAEILLASPNLKFLGLSSSLEEGHDSMNLLLLIEAYDDGRRSGGLDLLKLVELHLGVGYLPTQEYSPGIRRENYLAKLTDLTTLTALHINNWNAPLDYEMTVPFQKIDPLLFENAVNLQRVSASRLSEDIVELIQHHCSSQSSGSRGLVEVRVPRFYEMQKTAGTSMDYEYSRSIRGDALFSRPLSSIAPFNGRRLTIGSKANGGGRDLNNEVLRYISQCVDLEELVLGLLEPNVLDHEPWQYFKQRVLPKLPKLRVLIMPADDMDLQQTLVPQEPWQRDWSARFGPDGKVTDEAAVAVVLRKEEVVVEIFQQVKKARGKLRYLGIGREMYACMIATPYPSAIATFEVEGSGGNGIQSKTYQIIQLSRNESMSFEAMQSKAEEDPSSYD
jgi:hypothetical protein